LQNTLETRPVRTASFPVGIGPLDGRTRTSEPRASDGRDWNEGVTVVDQ
jgi:hypothetical protein